MDIAIWIGAAMTLAGVGGLLACVLLTVRARREAADDADLRARLRRVVAYNLAALLVSAVGLMAVITGIMLG